MLLQKTMIERVRELCRNDPRISAAFMFGSFAIGEGDEFSDIEFALFFSDESLPAVDQQEWVSRIEPVELYFQDDFGHHTAIFANMVRGEFHFMPASGIPVVESWQGYGWFPSPESTILVDRTGELERYLRPMIGGPPERDTAGTVRSVSCNFINLTLFGVNLLGRGENARAWAMLSQLHGNLLKLVRLSERTTAHWPTPSRGLENDLSAAAYERYRSCTADLDPASLRRAYRETWRWGCELMMAAARSHDVSLPENILEALKGRLEAAS